MDVIKVKKLPVLRMLGILSVIAVLLSSCRTQRVIYKEPIKEYGAEYLIEQLEKNQVHYQWLSAKYTVDYIQDKNKTSFRGQVRLKKDSAIWISISPLMGIEAARMLITPDSVKVMNRIESSYVLTSFNSFREKFNKALDFDMFQAFLLGNDFSFYDKSEFKASIDSWEYRLVTSNRQKLKNFVKENEVMPIIPIHHIWLDPDNYKITQMEIKEIVVDNRKLNARYGDFEMVGDNILPTRIVYDIESDENRIGIEVKYSKVTIDEELKLPFNIPDKYTEASGEKY